MDPKSWSLAISASRSGNDFLWIEGKATVVWRHKLVNVPHPVFVAENGKRVVTIRTYGKLGSNHSLVVYDETIEVQADYILNDFFTQIESMLFIQ